MERLRENLGGMTMAELTVVVTEAEVREFARRWPCFGPIRTLAFEWDVDGNLCAIYGDEGMDEAGVAALADDAKAGKVGVTS